MNAPTKSSRASTPTDPDEWGPFWAWFFQSWPRRWSAWLSKEPVEPAIDRLDLSRGDRVLDLGAGSGFYSLRLAQSVPEGEVLAIDGSASMVDRLRKAASARRLGKRIRAEVGDALGLAVPSGTVDAALVVSALHHVPDPERALHELRRVLRPGGRLVMVEGLREKGVDPRRHQGLSMTETELSQALKAAGFQPGAVERFGNWSLCSARAALAPHPPGEQATST